MDGDPGHDIFVYIIICSGAYFITTEDDVRDIKDTYVYFTIGLMRLIGPIIAKNSPVRQL